MVKKRRKFRKEEQGESRIPAHPSRRRRACRGKAGAYNVQFSMKEAQTKLCQKNENCADKNSAMTKLKKIPPTLSTCKQRSCSQHRRGSPPS